MREMFRTAFSAFTSLFRAVDLGARTVENYAKWAEGESSTFEEQGRIEREARTSQMRLSLDAAAKATTKAKK